MAHINSMLLVAPKPGWAQVPPWTPSTVRTHCLGFLHAGSRSKRPSLTHCHLLQLGSHCGFLLLLETPRRVKTLRDCHHAPSTSRYMAEQGHSLLQYLIDVSYQIFMICLASFRLKPGGQILSSTYPFPIGKENASEPGLANLMVFILPFSFILSIFPLAPLS